MAGILNTLTNFISPVTRNIHLRSRNTKFSKCLLARKPGSITIINHINSDQIQGNGGRDQPPPNSGGIFTFAASIFLPLALVEVQTPDYVAVHSSCCT